ncbi:diguanylate cyclase domain-containing protein [Aeromonas diversa]|uniref:GGDEF domain-containing protein n=1 Tax=Aeromonas diversa TaxID=502790 RepID=UPI0039A39C44
MQEWVPEEYSSLEELCTVVLGAIREKTDAHLVGLVLLAPQQRQLWLTHSGGLVEQCPAGSAYPPAGFLESSLSNGSLRCETFDTLQDELDEVERPLSLIRCAIPLKRTEQLQCAIYLETRRRVDRFAASQRYPLQLLAHYLAAELETRFLSGCIDEERDLLRHARRDLDLSLQVQETFLNLLRSLHEVSVHLAGCGSERELLREAVLQARGKLQIDRLAIFLIDEERRIMRGTWGTDEFGNLTDESTYVSAIPDHPVVQQALSSKDYVVLRDDVPLYYEHRVVGHGWNAMVSLWHDERPIGWIAADNLLHGRPAKNYYCEIFKQFAASLSQLLIRQRTEEALRRLNQELELRVCERTRELAQANQALALANRQLEAMSLEDPLTEIANRRHWDLFLSGSWDRARRDGCRLAVLMLDVDEFKAYNDSLGHPQGDRCLRQLAQLLHRCERRRANLVARYGGEEFAILLYAPSPGEAECLAERIHREIRHLAIPHPGSRVADFVTVSIGFSYVTPLSGDDWRSLMNQADQALYSAKQAGRAQSFSFE